MHEGGVKTYMIVKLGKVVRVFKRVETHSIGDLYLQFAIYFLVTSLRIRDNMGHQKCFDYLIMPRWYRLNFHSSIHGNFRFIIYINELGPHLVKPAHLPRYSVQGFALRAV